MLALYLLAAAGIATAMSSPYDERGLIGYGIQLYYPICANACRDVTPTANVSCSDGASAVGAGPSPSCLASNVPYLQTVAYCISSHCGEEIDLLDRERWWGAFVIENDVNAPKANLTYSEALSSISLPPNATLDALTLDYPVLVDENLYDATFNSYYSAQFNEFANSRWSLIVVASCALLPVSLSFLGLLPISTRTVSQVRSTLIDASLIQRELRIPLLGRMVTPTRGQAFLMMYIIGINIIACCVQNISVQPQAWYPDQTISVAVFVADRTGVIAISNIPLLILFAGRNNFLMWLTDWSHSTFLIMHRCVAIMATLQAITHSVLYLGLYSEVWGEYLVEEKTSAYWICGILATLGMTFMIPLAIRRIRTIAYEAFLITHIIGAVMVVVALWYHITLVFEHNYGYELWLEVAFAIWGFDRVFRVLRFLRHGSKLAVAYKIDDDYLRVDIPGVHASGYIFCYFPGLTWRVWENHPFSVASFNSRPPLPKTDEKSGVEENLDVLPLASGNSGVSLLIRNWDGTTRKIATRAVEIGATPMPFRVLVESSYGGNSHVISRMMREYPNIVCIAGGVGITPILPILEAHGGRKAIKLYWASRSRALVDAAKDLLDARHAENWAACDAKIFVEERMHLEHIIETEVKVGPTLVIVSGPTNMTAEARKVVARAGRNGAIVRYHEESFSW